MKSSIFRFLAITLVFIFCQSCVSIALKRLGAHQTQATTQVFTSNDKTVQFIPMHHVGKSVFYEDVYRITDSLGALGYVSFYEGVDTNITDSITLDVLKRKWRKMMGFYLDKSGYIDSNQRLMGRYKVSKKYVNQPLASELIAPNTQPENVDVTLEDLFGTFEERVAEIQLDDCDMQIPIHSAYSNCTALRQSDKKVYDRFHDDFILKYRNQYLAKAIQNHKNGKIIVVYGSGHLQGLLQELKALDSTWRNSNIKS